MKYTPDFFKSNCKHLLIKVLKNYLVCLAVLNLLLDVKGLKFSVHKRFGGEKKTALFLQHTDCWGKMHKKKKKSNLTGAAQLCLCWNMAVTKLGWCEGAENGGGKKPPKHQTP